MLSSWNKVNIIIITETAIYNDQRGITKIQKGYGSYPLHADCRTLTLQDCRTLTVYVWGCRFTCKNQRDHLKL